MVKKDIQTARRCMNYQNIKCYNKDCINLSCPLNKEYDYKTTHNKDYEDSE